MSHFIRSSKYRHVYCEAPKHDEKFENLRLATTTGEQQYIKGNTKFIAVALAGGGGPVGIFEHDKPGRMEAGAPVIAGHKSAVLDFDFNPFHEHLIATASDDCTAKVFGIPEAGLTETITEPLVDLHGHGRKVTLLRFHPTASNVLASISADFTVKLWDIEKGSEMFSLDGVHEQLIQDINWSPDGKTYATSCKDKKVRIVDARDNAVAQEIPDAHEGAKSVKLTFLGDKEKLATVGFTRQSQRQIKIWDPRNLGAALKTEKIDQAAGVIIPYYDEDTSVLYLAGKGDGNVRYYEILPENPLLFKLSEYSSTTPAKGMAFIPKRGCNVMKCETARGLKLTSNAIEPLSFIVPRKSDAFQEDIFPPTFAGVPACTSDEWLDGIDKMPGKISLDPSSDGTVVQAAAAEEASTPMMTRSAALAYIEKLKEAMTAAGVPIPDP
mmetsp:Transcript_35983/g.62205  ORF Transcript_35983/g.62205 Transcript_35983/m.62205 type:complete len:439 (-) Transcript_35983:316-1632(-)